MNSAPALDRPPVGRALQWAYIVALVLAVVLLHLLAGHWLDKQKRLLGQATDAKPPVEVILLQPQLIRQIASTSTAVETAPARPDIRETHRTPVKTAAEPSVLQALDNGDAGAASAASDAAGNAVGNTVLHARTGEQPAAVAAQTASASAGKKDGEQFSLPPAADLRYDTFVNGMQNMPGVISWISDGKNYDLIVSVPIPFVGKYSYQSHGHVDAFGLAPERYIEQRGSRGRDETRFDRSAKRITFTRTPTALALPDGAQDRFSMVFQLASLVRGNPARYTPGVTRSFYVVDNDSGENWPVETLGTESVRVGETYVQALHFMRLPRHADDRRKIDVWLAPTLGYFPVRIMQTEPNGTQIELLLHDAPQRLDALSATAGESTTADATRSQTAGRINGSAAGPGIVSPATLPAARDRP